MNAITRQMTMAHIAVTGFVAGAFDRMKSDRGQGSVEYVGIILVVGVIMAAIIAITLTSDDGFGIPAKLTEGINAGIDKVLGK